MFGTLSRCLFHSLVKPFWYQQSTKMASTSFDFFGDGSETGNEELEERVERLNAALSENTMVGREDERLRDVNFPVRKLEEYEIDFDDTRKFTVQRWGDIVKAAIATLPIEGNLFAAPLMDLY